MKGVRDATAPRIGRRSPCRPACIASSRAGANISTISPAAAPTTPARASSFPNDPQSPEFWQAVRQAQGIVGPVPTDTIDALIDAYETAWPTLPRKLSDGTQEQYRRSLRVVRDAWGDLRAEALRPSHVQALWRRSADNAGQGEQRARRAAGHVPMGDAARASC